MRASIGRLDSSFLQCPVYQRANRDGVAETNQRRTLPNKDAPTQTRWPGAAKIVRDCRAHFGRQGHLCHSLALASNRDHARFPVDIVQASGPPLHRPAGRAAPTEAGCSSCVFRWRYPGCTSPRQNADFAEEQIPSARGFTLTITPPQEPYWRCGFVLAPEEYIREGRTDVTIAHYFLFHIGQGHIGPSGRFDPSLATGPHFRMYERDQSEREWPFDSESPVQIHVELGRSDGRVTVTFSGQNVSATLTPAYFRYLCILA
ncbi:hypothetical protein SBA3_2700007 [Candidatus Sulfopaludibacter sp. SbA3]|nr:hypothetical protein SBA3_2700007 [Candidatus Sulfopaludibacter sp. SbA3]